MVDLSRSAFGAKQMCMKKIEFFLSSIVQLVQCTNPFLENQNELMMNHTQKRDLILSTKRERDRRTIETFKITNSNSYQIEEWHSGTTLD